MMGGQFHLSKEIACEWESVLDAHLYPTKQSQNTKNYIVCYRMQVQHPYLSVVWLSQPGQVKAICMILLEPHAL